MQFNSPLLTQEASTQDNRFIDIDGSQGEGGGQILRSSLTLAMIYGLNIRVNRIRAGRKKPGLLRQHLTCVNAAAAICQAKVTGAELGSTQITFMPKEVQAGDYEFAIGSAGSTSLVIQTLLPALISKSKGRSTLKLSGGTHNGMSPSSCFLQQAYLPWVRRLGAKVEVNFIRHGFFPAGGGALELAISPYSSPQALRFAPSAPQQIQVRSLLSKLAYSIGEREVTQALKKLGQAQEQGVIEQVQSPGPGNSLQVRIPDQTHTHLFEVLGERDKRAETVANQAAQQAKHFLHSGAQVCEHLADQLLLLILQAGQGSFTTTEPSLHTRTNIAVIAQLTGRRFDIEGERDNLWRISLQ